MPKSPRNLFEKRIYSTLKRRKVSFKYEGVRLPYVLAKHYIPDFMVETPLGLVYIETKGYLRQEDKTKMLAVKRQHPELDIRILFYAARKEQIKWAEKNGFKYAVSSIPSEWLKGL
jgi:Phage endonuclease I